MRAVNSFLDSGYAHITVMTNQRSHNHIEKGIGEAGEDIPVLKNSLIAAQRGAHGKEPHLIADDRLGIRKGRAYNIDQRQKYHEHDSRQQDVYQNDKDFVSQRSFAELFYFISHNAPPYHRLVSVIFLDSWFTTTSIIKLTSDWNSPAAVEKP